MTHEPDFDSLLEQLLDAARREAPIGRVKEQALRNAGRVRRVPWGGKWLIAALAFAGILLALLWGGKSSHSEIRAEREYLKAQGLRSVESTPKSKHEPASAAPHTAPLPVRSVGSKSRPITLEVELRMLDRAREALVQGDSSRALRELDAYDRGATGRRLGAEASLLRIQILAASGRSEEASALARKFITDHPASPLAERARAFAAQPIQPAQEEGARP